MCIKKETFGLLENNEVNLFVLSNSNDTKIKITNYGCIITAIETKDKNDNLKDVVLGFDSLDGYLGTHPYFGAVIGRFGNRIENAQFALNGKTYSLFKNNENNHLHGGEKGFDKVLWDTEIIDNKLHLSYISIDNEEGYPGNLKLKVIYSLTEENELVIEYIAETDKDTILNLTNHSYFNLNGDGHDSILNHKLQINANSYTPINSECIPTGEIASVANSPFDFTTLHCIGDNILNDNKQLHFGNGYDHNFVLDNPKMELKKIAKLIGNESGIIMDVLTTEPGIQLYTGNGLNVKNGKNGDYTPRSAVCLETQHYPDSPNKPNFPTTVLKQGNTYKSTTIYKFAN